MNTDLATVNASAGSLIGPVMDVAMARERLMQFQQFVKEYLVEGEDFGTIPSTPKPTLYKPGADKLCELYGLADEYEVTQRTEAFDKGLFDYEVKCILVRKPEMTLVSSGLGSCNSYETKYRWRDSKRQCPACGKDAMIKGKEEYGGGWLCFAKKGGCGAKFGDNDTAITGQVVGRTQNEDVADIKNTILKMALKRAKISAVLSATRSSGVFTQDLEDIPKWEPPAQLAEGAISHQPASASATPAPAQPPAQRPAASPEPSQEQKRDPQQYPYAILAGTTLTCTPLTITEKTRTVPKTEENPEGTQPYIFVHFKGNVNSIDFPPTSEFSCFDTGLFEAIRAGLKQECQFKVEVKEKAGKMYINVKDAMWIDNAKYVEGKPVNMDAEPA